MSIIFTDLFLIVPKLCPFVFWGGENMKSGRVTSCYRAFGWR
jgi:hypothetical protein